MYAYFRNDIPDTEKISLAIKSDSNLCSGHLKAFRQLAADHIKRLKKAGGSPKSTDYKFMNFRLKRLYMVACQK